jgi:hypothetical protein
MTLEMNNNDTFDDEEEDNHFDLIPSVEALRQRCVHILDECKAWNDKKPIEGLYRYTNSLTAEMHFIEKVNV